MKALLTRNFAILVYFLLLPVLGWGQTYDVSTLAGGTWLDGPALGAKFYGPTDIDTDSAGNIYVADNYNNRIRKISPAGIVTTLAGSGNYDFADGIGTAASFKNPTGVAVDGSGNVYVADAGNNRIRKISPAGVVTTLAGSGTPGFADDTGSLASFNDPRGVALDANGNVYVADRANHRIRKISPAGAVTTLAGSGIATYTAGNGITASFAYPEGITVDATGYIYVADLNNNRIRKISPTGVVTTFAGSGTPSDVNGTGTAASFDGPKGVTVDAVGNLYVVGQLNNRIRKISPAAVVTNFAGSGNPAFADGIGLAASFYNPYGLAVDGTGNIYVADAGNNRIRKINAIGAVTTLAGSGTATYADGTGMAVSFNEPTGVAVDGTGNVYVADKWNHRIRKISPSGVVTTLAGSGTRSYADGAGTAASFNGPSAVIIDATGNLYVADEFNYRIRKITQAGVVTTLAGSGNFAYADGLGTAASFKYPSGLTLDATGNLYVADKFNNRIRKISPAGVVTTFAGSGIGSFADGIGTAASFNHPTSVAVDTTGNLYVTDKDNHRIRKISSAGVVTTLAGSRNPTFADGVGTAASFNSPYGVAVDILGNLYVADNGNHRIRKISPTGVVTTLAGSGNNGGSDASGMAASFNYPAGIALDRAGNVYVADESNQAIRKLTPSCTNPATPTISGTPTFCQGSYTQLTSSTPNGNLWSTGDTTRSITVNTAGNYTVRAVSGSCTSNVSDTFRVVVNQPSSSAISQTICQGSSFIFGGVIRTTSGTYIDTLRNALDCDSVVTLSLTVNPVSVSAISRTICEGTSYVFGGMATTTSGNYIDSLRNVNGCDSVVTLSLTVNPLPVPTISGNSSFCQGSYTQLTSSSPTGNLWSTGDTTRFINIGAAGNYTVRVFSGACTSAASQPFVVSLAGPSPTTINFDTTSSRCYGSRIQLTPAGTYSHYAWNTGETTRSILVRQTGSYSVQVANADSCFGLPSPPIFIAFDTNWCTVQIFRLGVDSITASVWADSYIWFLDGIQLLTNNTLKTIPVQGNGVYTFRAVTAGRTSGVSNPIVITSAKNILATNKFQVYPNPATGKVTVKTNGAGTIQILDVVGKVVLTQPATGTDELNISILATGVYTVKVGNATQKLVVQ